MSVAHGFWTVLALACLIWYSTVTFLVAYRGVIDIRSMLVRLRRGQTSEGEDGLNRE